MIRFETLEKLGLSFAGMTEKADGDFGGRDEHALRRSICEAHGLDADQLHLLKQVHGTQVWETPLPADRRQRIIEGDALITNEPGVPISIFASDCVPLLMFDPVKGAIAAAHAGWQGTFDCMARETVKALVRRYGTNPADLHVVIGPSAGVCCYEVSVEMADDFAEQSLPREGRHLDLWGANRIHLVAAGVPEDQVHVAESCTICRTDHHSFRRGGTLEKNLAVISV